jgi:hypothetical protein
MTDINKELEAIAEDVFVDEDEQLVEEPANAPTLHAEPAMPMQHMDGQDEVEDMGPAVVSPNAPSDPGKEASKKAKRATPPGAPGGKGFASKASAKQEEVSLDGDDEEDSEEITIDERIAAMDFSDDVNALTEGGDDEEESASGLTAEFKQKAAIIFEAAVKAKIRSELERIEEEYEEAYAQAFENAKEDMTEKVDGYLSYVVEEWMKTNEMAVEHKMKTEIAEGFITGLKTLFEEHNIAIPTEQFDMLDAAAEKVGELEGKLNETIESNVRLSQEVAELKKSEILSDVASDLADTEVEKFAGLTENVEYETESNFREKVETIKESYFPKVQLLHNDDTAAPLETEIDVDVSDTMAAYMTAIRRSTPFGMGSTASGHETQ